MSKLMLHLMPSPIATSRPTPTHATRAAHMPRNSATARPTLTGLVAEVIDRHRTETGRSIGPWEALGLIDLDLTEVMASIAGIDPPTTQTRPYSPRTCGCAACVEGRQREEERGDYLVLPDDVPAPAGTFDQSF